MDSENSDLQKKVDYLGCIHKKADLRGVQLLKIPYENHPKRFRQISYSRNKKTYFQT